MIRTGADPNCVNVDGITPLRRAVRQQCLSDVESLLHHGASVGMRTDSRPAPLHLACKKGKGRQWFARVQELAKRDRDDAPEGWREFEEKDGRGGTLTQSANSERMRMLLQSL